MWRRASQPACGVCKDPCYFTCQGCKTTHYCSEDHQAIHWEEHKTSCQLYAKIYIKQRTLAYPNRRRTLLAQSHFKKGQQIFDESPLLESPDNLLKTPKELLESDVTTSCIVCRSMLPFEGKGIPNSCHNCGWPLCGDPNCSSFHSEMECRTLAKNKSVGPEQFSKAMPPHRFVYYLRILKIDDKNSTNYYKIMEMDVHPEIDEHEVTTADIVTPVKALPEIASEQSLRYKEFIRLSELYNNYHTSEEEKTEIIRVIQAADWNSRNINDMPSQKKSSRQTYQGLFYIAPSAPQTCTPNASCVVTFDYTLHCFATQNIDSGEVITISQDPSGIYLDNIGRRRRLRERLRTKCTCSRCGDPIENYNGAFVCCDFQGDDIPGCKIGNLLPQLTEKKSKSLKQIRDVWTWKCDHCPVVRSMQTVGRVRTKILKKFELFSKKRNGYWTAKLYPAQKNMILDESITTLIDAEGFINFMQEQEGILHSNNFILTRMKIKLMEWYSDAIHKLFMLGKQNEFQPQILDAGKKLYEMSRSVLELVNLYRPGLSEMRSYLEYYMQQGFILTAPNVLRTMITSDEEKTEFRKKIAEMTPIRRSVMIFCKHTLNWNRNAETVIERLEWLDADGQLYKLLRKKFPFLYSTKPKGTKRILIKNF